MAYSNNDLGAEGFRLFAGLDDFGSLGASGSSGDIGNFGIFGAIGSSFSNPFDFGMLRSEWMREEEYSSRNIPKNGLLKTCSPSSSSNDSPASLFSGLKIKAQSEDSSSASSSKTSPSSLFCDLQMNAERNSCTCAEHNCRTCAVPKRIVTNKLSPSQSLGYYTSSSTGTVSPICPEISDASRQAAVQARRREMVKTPHPEVVRDSRPEIIRAPLSIPAIPVIFCERHPRATREFCQTCNEPICVQCGMVTHYDHRKEPLDVAIENATAQSNLVTTDLYVGVKTVTADLHAIEASYRFLECMVKQTKDDLGICFRNVMLAMEYRIRKLSAEIDDASRVKLSTLRDRENKLRSGLIQLKEMIRIQEAALETLQIQGNPLDLKIANDQAAGVIFEVQQTRRTMTPREEGYMAFTASEKPLLDGISSLGNVLTSNPGPIGDRRRQVVRSNALPVQQHNFHHPQSIATPSTSLANHANLNFGNDNRILVWTQRYETSPTIKIIGKHPYVHDINNLCRPWGVACDREGNIIVADRSNNRIMVYSEDGSCLRKFGTSGTGPVQFNRPAGVAVDNRRRIIVADKDNHRIQILTLNGSFVLEFGRRGESYGEFNYPWDVATNSDGQIVVSDTRNHRLQLFSSEGIFLRSFGMNNVINGFKAMDSPRGVSFNPEGNIVMTDFNLHRILVVDSTFTNARVLHTHGEEQPLMRPQGVVVDDYGNIIVSDSRNYMIKVFNSEGLLTHKFGKSGSNIDQMDRPAGVALLPDGRIVFVDFGNHRVVID